MTPTQAQLEELATRCEQATGPDAVLDVLIGCAVVYVPDKAGCEWARADRGWQYIPAPRMTNRMGCADKSGNVAAHWEPPAYTASLDAAMTLVPEGMVAGVVTWVDDTDERPAGIVGYRKQHPQHEPADWQVQAVTPALALCAAALRARHHLKGETL